MAIATAPLLPIQIRAARKRQPCAAWRRRSAEGFASTLCRTFCAGLFVAICCRSWRRTRSRPDRGARRAAPSERLQALQREADRLASQERTLLGDLRKLEVERQISTEELRQADADATRFSAEIATASDRMSRARSAGRVASGRSCARGSSKSTSWDRRAICAAAARHVRPAAARPGGADGGGAGEARSRSRRLASADARRARRGSRTTLDDAAAGSSKALRADAARAQAAAERATQARNDLVRDIDRRRDLNAQLAGELQAAQQKLQLTLRNAAAGARAEAARCPSSVPRRSRLARAGHRPAAASADGRRSAPRPTGSRSPPRRAHPCTAVHDGIVAFADAFTGFGNLVIVDHGSQTFSLYGNLLDMTRHKGRARRARARRSARSARRPRDQPGCISSCASTVSRSTRYNG